MPNYKFPNWNTELVNPNIIMNGDAGGHFINGVSQGTFYVDLKLEVGPIEGPKSEFFFRLTGEVLPSTFSVEDIQAWVDTQIQRYEE